MLHAVDAFLVTIEHDRDDAVRQLPGKLRSFLGLLSRDIVGAESYRRNAEGVEADHVVGTLDQYQAELVDLLGTARLEEVADAEEFRAAMKPFHEVELLWLLVSPAAGIPLLAFVLVFRITAEPGQHLAGVVAVGVHDLASHGAATLVLAADIARQIAHAPTLADYQPEC